MIAQGLCSWHCVTQLLKLFCFFRGHANPHLTQLREILITFAAYNHKLGYAQGMNDILARFLYVFGSEVSIHCWCFIFWCVCIYCSHVLFVYEFISFGCVYLLFMYATLFLCDIFYLFCMHVFSPLYNVAWSLHILLVFKSCIVSALCIHMQSIVIHCLPCVWCI